MDVSYLRVVLVVLLGAALYYAVTVAYNPEAANVVVLAYAIVTIPVYQIIGRLQRGVASATG